MTTPPKEFALKVLNGFDELARPEIQNVLIAKIWDYVKSYSERIILRKPDEEIQIKLLSIHKIFSEHFKDVDLAVEIKKGELLGSIPVPNVGHLAQVKKLNIEDNQKAAELIKELGL